MADLYAEGLSQYPNKGVLGVKESFDSKEELHKKVKKLAEWIKSSKHVVVHTGAGISTSAGIPDFRGPNGVWTLQEKGKKPGKSVAFEEAVPTKTHMALVKLIEEGYVKYIVSQNIDGLHMRSGIDRKYISELHGNMFIEQCPQCMRQFIRKSVTPTVGQVSIFVNCPGTKSGGRQCRGVLRDFILDWEQNLPANDLLLAEHHSNLADLSICLGTTLQINPSGKLPLSAKQNKNGKLVICNLQPTKYDKKCDLIIRRYVDEIFSLLLEHLDLKCDEYNPEFDPIKKTGLLEWTIPNSIIADLKKKENVKKKSTKREPLPVKRRSSEIFIDDSESAISRKIKKKEINIKKGNKAEKVEIKEDKVEKVEIKEEDKVDKVKIKEEDKVEKVEIKEEDMVDKVIIKEEDKAEKINIHEEDKVEKNNINKEDEVEKIIIKEEDKVETIHMKEEGKVEKVNTNEEDKIETMIINEEDRVGKVNINKEDRVEKMIVNDEDRVEKVTINGEDKAEKGEKESVMSINQILPEEQESNGDSSNMINRESSAPVDSDLVDETQKGPS